MPTILPTALISVRKMSPVGQMSVSATSYQHWIMFVRALSIMGNSDPFVGKFSATFYRQGIRFVSMHLIMSPIISLTVGSMA